MSLPALETLKPLILKIANEYHDSEGRVQWTRALKEHPDWGKQLQFNKNPGRIHAALNNLRKRGMFTPGKSAATLEAPGTGFMPITLPERAPVQPMATAEAPEANYVAAADAIIEQIVRQYHDGDKCNYVRAWREHPEWKAAVGATTEKGLKHFYTRARAVMIRLGMVKEKPYRPKGAAAKVESNGHGQESPAYTDGLPYCPHCGHALQAWNRAYNASMKEA